MTVTLKVGANQHNVTVPRHRDVRAMAFGLRKIDLRL